jgi:hypothetical protein
VTRALTAALAAVLLTTGTLAGASAAAPTAGRWSIAMRGDDTTLAILRLESSERSDAGYSRWSWSSSVAPADVGLSAERLRGAVAPVTFQIGREPGTFSCTGSAGEGSGAGGFTYAPNAAFDNALAARGLGRPTSLQSLELALAAMTLAFVDQIRASAPRSTVADLVRVVQHGVSPRYAAELAALGYRVSGLDQLVMLRDHGVTPRYIGALAGAGYKNLSTDDLIVLRDHGVSGAFVDRLKSHGYTNLSIRDLIRLRDAGI